MPKVVIINRCSQCVHYKEEIWVSVDRKQAFCGAIKASFTTETFRVVTPDKFACPLPYVEDAGEETY